MRQQPFLISVFHREMERLNCFGLKTEGMEKMSRSQGAECCGSQLTTAQESMQESPRQLFVFNSPFFRVFFLSLLLSNPFVA